MIIDEASLQDIVPGILALGCAKNLIVVGDNRQLAHIPVELGLQAPADAYDCERYSLLDSCIGVFKEALPRTLLKEHYRCHPRIIQFCNQQFYDNALVPMTEDKGEAPLRLVVTAKGNHARQNTNLRELDSYSSCSTTRASPSGWMAKAVVSSRRSGHRSNSPARTCQRISLRTPCTSSRGGSATDRLFHCAGQETLQTVSANDWISSMTRA